MFAEESGRDELVLTPKKDVALRVDIVKADIETVSFCPLPVVLVAVLVVFIVFVVAVVGVTSLLIDSSNIVS